MAQTITLTTYRLHIMKTFPLNVRFIQFWKKTVDDNIRHRLSARKCVADTRARFFVRRSTEMSTISIICKQRGSIKPGRTNRSNSIGAEYSSPQHELKLHMDISLTFRVWYWQYSPFVIHYNRRTPNSDFGLRFRTASPESRSSNFTGSPKSIVQWNSILMYIINTHPKL